MSEKQFQQTPTGPKLAMIEPNGSVPLPHFVGTRYFEGKPGLPVRDAPMVFKAPSEEPEKKK